MAIVAAAAAAASSLPSEGICHSISCGNGTTSNSMKSPIDGRRVHDFTGMRGKSSVFGSSHFLWLSMGHDLCLSKVCVAADYSDSVPDSSNYMNKQGYHPLEELKVSHNTRPARLSPAETARTTVEANRNALLVFPGTVHCEPHEQISWSEFQYLVDDYGDIYFIISEDANILEDRGADNPVNALIGMDIPIYDNRRTASQYDLFDAGSNEEFPFDDDYVEVLEMEESNFPVNWGLPDTTSIVHPIYFSKCLTKALNMEYDKKMNHPSNGVSILGYLRPAFVDEESYLRMICHPEDVDGYNLERIDTEELRSKSFSDRRDSGLTLYRLEILKIKLYSVYGCQSDINSLDFQDAEPDILVHSSLAILEHFNQNCDDALKALCKKKGLDVEGACLIGVDSLGMDVRVFKGSEVKTHRFPFKVQANSVSVAEKQIRQLLFPRSRRKKCVKSWRSA
ncbi:hypothetical protein HN51_049580 [Arachis hypogaea]|uniref:uncharacterized protein At3g49140 n=1 Tax=Arachis hypogaea TaxID=3818 RepID=UPI000DEDD3AE|nr:uncharacterized protein At3g49140 [Arachis hypogaea]QHN91157.1 uncharacterized protein DS421_17g572490 [Arachis hypogaea]